MNKKIISEKTYTDTLEKVIGIMRQRKIDLNVRHILFVPDKYTLYAERLLYHGTCGAFDAEVLTFNRLFFRLCRQDSYLSKQGSVMLTRKILSEVAPELKCFKRCYSYKGFAAQVYETVAQLTSCRINPEDIPTTDSALGIKMHDIALIYSRYLQSTAGKHVDSGGRFELLIDALKTTNYFNNAHVYFANFDSFTAQTHAILELISQKSLSASVGEPDFSDLKMGEAEIYEASDNVSALKAVAKRIRNNVFEGMKYDDMCLVTASPNFEQIKRIFREFDIPFYIDKKYILGEHPLSCYLKTLLDAGLRQSRNQFIALAKNPYSQILPSDSFTFENYCNKYCIDYLAFNQPFTKAGQGDENALAISENVRLKLVNKIRAAFEKYSHAETATEFYNFVFSAVNYSHTAEVTAELNNVSADWGNVSERILAVAETLKNIFLDERVKRELLTDAFFEGLQSTKISLLPALSDTVTVGEAAIFRGGRFKHLFAIGFAEGAFPCYSSDCGIITDSEIDKLMIDGVDLQPKIEEINERTRLEALSVLCCADKITLSYSSGESPSILIHNVKAAAKKVHYNSPLLEWEKLRKSNDFNFMARHAASRGNASEMLAASLSDTTNYLGFESELKAALDFPLEKFTRTKGVHVLNSAKSLFFRGGATTISRIQEYFACPYKHFLKYGLKLSEREDGELSPLDIGNFLHKTIELFVAEGQFDHIEETVTDIVDKICEQEEKYRYGANESVIRQITQEAVQISSIVASQICGGSFKSLGQEMRFSEQDNMLKTLCFNCADKKITLIGVIDRADIFNNFVRVIDYKTGFVEFKFSDLFFGLKIQLMLYMRIMRENGFQPAGMFYFPFSSRWNDNEFSHRLKGIYNNDAALIYAMDSRLKEPGVKSEIISASTNQNLGKAGDTVLSKIHGDSAFSTQELNLLCDYAYAVLQGGAHEILNGNISPAPYNSDVCCCAYCEYSSVCDYDYRKMPVRDLYRVNSEYVLTAMGYPLEE